MSIWGKVCRICASPADYDIFSKIPIYLHASPKDYPYWPNPINELITAITGLKISRDDELPKNICALCVSYLKHAYTFREKAIESTLSFIAIKDYHDVVKSKKDWRYEEILRTMITKRPDNVDNNIAPVATADEDNTTNCFYKDQNKVNKQLIANSNGCDSFTRTLGNQTKNVLIYLMKLYGNTANEPAATDDGQGPLLLRGKTNSFPLATSHSSGDVPECSQKQQNCDDDFARITSSDEYEDTETIDKGDGNAKANVFSYTEKIFEEDDIMDLDELRDLMNITIETTCKEHKCVYCWRRFMTDESLQEHLKTCIDFKLTEFMEEIKTLHQIRKLKEISPHEYFRRTIFSIRKISEWLKENLVDTTMPDLGSKQFTEPRAAANNKNKQNDENVPATIETDEEIYTRRKSIDISNNILHLVDNKPVNSPKVNRTVLASSIQQENKAPIARHTPINMSNNILLEIERSENINALKKTLQKPIAVLATTSLNNENYQSDVAAAVSSPRRQIFLEKLQNATKEVNQPATGAKPLVLSTTPTPLRAKMQCDVSKTPLIAVRKDLLDCGAADAANDTVIRQTQVSPLLDLLRNSSSSNTNTPLNACARCPPCNMVFETLHALEVHNAMQHNNRVDCQSVEPGIVPIDEEHQRIIALFENDEF